jgi:hypothetical protein
VYRSWQKQRAVFLRGFLEEIIKTRSSLCDAGRTMAICLLESVLHCLNMGLLVEETK